MELLNKAIIVAWLTSSLFFFSTNAQTCTNQSFTNRLFAACNDLPRLNSHLYWTYSPENGTISIAYRAPLSSPGWIAWAINTERSGMIGAQAVVAIRLPNGSAAAHTTRLSDYQPTLAPMELSFAVTGIEVEAGASDTTIFAEVQLPGNGTSIVHVWQQGPLSDSNSPVGHPLSSANRRSTGTLDLLSNGTTAGGGPGGDSLTRRQNVCNYLCHYSCSLGVVVYMLFQVGYI